MLTCMMALATEGMRWSVRSADALNDILYEPRSGRPWVRSNVKIVLKMEESNIGKHELSSRVCYLGILGDGLSL